MSMTRRDRTRQDELWCPTQKIVSVSNPFYDRLNALLHKHAFDDFVEDLCETYYQPGPGRPSIAPGVYFRMIFVGYFEQIASERGICWRIGDSLSLRRFVGLELTSRVPDHSTLSITRQRYGLDVSTGVFHWLLGVMRSERLLKGKCIGVDSTTLQANASMKSLRNKVTEQSYKDYAAELASEDEQVPETSTAAEDAPSKDDPPEPPAPKPSAREVRRKDRKRRKKMSNLVWESPADPDAKITRMKNGSTRMAHKIEHAVDLDTGALLGVEVYGGCEGDTRTIGRTLSSVLSYEDTNQTVEEVVTDAGYHSKAVLEELADAGIRSYIPGPKRGKPSSSRKTKSDRALYENRRRQSRAKGKALHRKRGEYVERTFQHLYDRCGWKRLHLRGTETILKRVILQAAAFNLSLVLRKQLGAGTPKGWKEQNKVAKSKESKRIRAKSRTNSDMERDEDSRSAVIFNSLFAIPGIFIHSWQTSFRKVA